MYVMTFFKYANRANLEIPPNKISPTEKTKALTSLYNKVLDPKSSLIPTTNYLCRLSVKSDGESLMIPQNYLTA